MIGRRKLLIALGASALAIPLAPAYAQQQGRKIARIGYLSVTAVERDRGWVTAFREGLRELGYAEGRNIVIESRHADGHAERLPALALELARLKIDVFVVYGAPAAVQAAQKAGNGKIPIVMTVAVDPVRNGLVASLARPGGNVTGLSDLHAGMVGKRLQLLKEVVPATSRVAVLLNPATPHALLQLEDLRVAAAALGMKLFPMEVTGPAPDDIERAYAKIQKERPEALLVIPDGTIFRESVSAFTNKHRLPAIGTVREWAEAGFFMSYGTNFADLWRRSAVYVDKILKGAKPADLPIEQPTVFELVINMKTVKALGIKIPNSILVRADKVIE